MSEQRLTPEQIPNIHPDMLVFVDNVLQLNLSETGGLASSAYGLELNLSNGLASDSYGLTLTIEDASLVLSSYGLKVNPGPGLTTDLNGLTLRFADIDSGLDFDGDGVKVKIATAGVAGGIKPPNSGHGWFLSETGSWATPPGIGIALDPIGGLEVGIDGLKIKLDYTTDQSLGLGADGLYVNWETDGGITADAGEGLRVKIDTTVDESLIVGPNGLTVDYESDGGITANAGEGLRVKLDTDPGIQTTATGTKIKLDTNPGLQLASTGIKIKLDTNPGLVLGSGGIKGKVGADGGLDINANGFFIKLDTNCGIQTTAYGTKLITASSMVLGGVIPNGVSSNYLNGNGGWTAVSGLPAGIGQYKVITSLNGSTAVWDYPRGHGA